MFFIFSVSLIQANIFEIDSIKQVKDLENDNTLVLFDIDHTLLQSVLSSKPRKLQYFSKPY